MSRRLNDLIPAFRTVVFELLARCVEEGYPVKIINTSRTAVEQAAYLKQGTSWTKHSRHLTGEAIDLCPIASWRGPGTTKLDWDADSYEWLWIGQIAEKLGLKWGVWKASTEAVPAWRRRGPLVNIDLGHIEWPREAPADTADCT